MRFVDDGFSGPGSSEPLFSTLGDMLGGLRDAMFSGAAPVVYPVSNEPVGSLEFRPKEVLALAGAPNNGKTALGMQWLCDALRLTPNIRGLVVNVEMSVDVLVRRQIARLSGKYLGRVMQNDAQLRSDEDVQRAFATLESIGDRLAFMAAPFSIERIVEAAMVHQPQILVVDYIQRIECCEGVADSRQRLNAIMQEFRRLAIEGRICVVLVSAVARTASKRDGGYDSQSLGLGSFRESSEVEYGADEAFILVRDSRHDGFIGSRDEGHDGTWPKPMLLKHVKSRNNERLDVSLAFDGRVQQFRVSQDGGGGNSSPRQFYGDPNSVVRGSMPVIDNFSDLLDGDPEDRPTDDENSDDDRPNGETEAGNG